jgi:hypothetical protein
LELQCAPSAIQNDKTTLYKIKKIQKKASLWSTQIFLLFSEFLVNFFYAGYFSHFSARRGHCNPNSRSVRYIVINQIEKLEGHCKLRGKLKGVRIIFPYEKLQEPTPSIVKEFYFGWMYAWVQVYVLNGPLHIQAEAFGLDTLLKYPST